MTVLHLDTGRDMRGGQWQALLLMEALAKRGHQQQLLARADSPLIARARDAGLRAETLRPGLRLPSAGIIHAHDAAAHTAAIMRFRSAPLVVSRRVAFPVRRGLLSRAKYSRAEWYIAVSQYVARELIFAGVAEERVTVIFDGVRLPDLAATQAERAAFRAQWNIAPDAFVAGTLTTLHEKPVQPLLDASERRPRMQLLVAASDLAAPARKNNINFLPPPPDISAFFSALDVFVYLSEMEGLGSAALLAMAHGIPVIASDTGGLPEIVRPGDTGILVRNVAEDVGAALETLYADRDARLAMGARARRLVQQHATDDIMARNTESVYGKALESSSRFAG